MKSPLEWKELLGACLNTTLPACVLKLFKSAIPNMQQAMLNFFWRLSGIVILNRALKGHSPKVNRLVFSGTTYFYILALYIRVHFSQYLLFFTKKTVWNVCLIEFALLLDRIATKLTHQIKHQSNAESFLKSLHHKNQRKSSCNFGSLFHRNTKSQAKHDIRTSYFHPCHRCNWREFP